MESALLKQKRNYYNKNRIPYEVVIDNNYSFHSARDFVFWDDASEVVTVFRKNSQRGQGTFVAEEFTSEYAHIQHIKALHQLDTLEQYMRDILPAGSYTDAQLEIVMKYMTNMTKDESYIEDLKPEYTNKLDKKVPRKFLPTGQPNPDHPDNQESDSTVTE